MDTPTVVPLNPTAEPQTFQFDKLKCDCPPPTPIEESLNRIANVLEHIAKNGIAVHGA